MTKQSETLEGRFSTLKDNVQILAQTIGTLFLPIIADLLEKLMPVVQTMIKWVEENPKLTKWIIIISGVLAGLVATLGVIGLVLPGLIAGFGLVATALAGVSALPIIVVTTAVIGLTTAMVKLIPKLKEFDTIKNIREKISGFGGDIIARMSGITPAHKLSDVVNVDDAIITPQGKVIKTAPDDFIIATKDPGSMDGGSTFNFDFTNATISNKEQFIDDIKNQLGRGLQLKELGI
jgi:hypothetical protein